MSNNPFLSDRAEVYKLLQLDIEENVHMMITSGQAASVIKFLDRRGLLDYDTLKEVYLNVNG